MPPANPNVQAPSYNEQFANLISRFRLIEDRQANLQRKIHLMEENMLSSSKEVKTELNVLKDELVELKRAIKGFDDFVEKVSASLENLATREEVKLIERYVNLLDPTNFISRKQLEHEVKRAVEDHLGTPNR
ncbi:MAG: hypothetical protein ACMXYM_02150 [Candidatus Woesearchaeota archaeon]